MKTPSFRFIFSILVTWLFIQPMVAQPPSLVNFRGQLLDNSNQPVTDTVSVGLKIFASETGGSALYTEEIGNIEVRNGQYAFQFGSAGTPDFTGVIQSNAETWVEVSINNIPLSRQRFVSVPYALNAGSAPIASGAVTREMLSQEVLNDLNRTQISYGSITREMLAEDLQGGLISQGMNLANPFGFSGQLIIQDEGSFTVPENKVLVVFSGRNVTLSTGESFASFGSGGAGGTYSIVPGGTEIEGEGALTGTLVDPIEGVAPIINIDASYTVPSGKTLVIVSSSYGLKLNNRQFGWIGSGGGFTPIPSGVSVTFESGWENTLTHGGARYLKPAWSGYIVDSENFENMDKIGGGYYQRVSSSLSSLYFPYGYDGEPVVGGNEYIVPEGEVLLVTRYTRANDQSNFINLDQHPFIISDGQQVVILDENTSFDLGANSETYGFNGLLFPKNEMIEPVLGGTSYTVPSGKNLVILSNAGNLRTGEISFPEGNEKNPSFPFIFPSNTELFLNSLYLSNPGFTGYLIDANRSLGGGLISTGEQGSISTVIENGTITREMLDADLRDDLNLSAFQSAHSLSSLYMPYGYDGEPVVGGNEYTVPEGKVLAIMDAGFNPSGVSGNSEILVQHENTYFWVSRPGEIVLVDQNKSLGVGRRNNGVFYPESNRGFVGLLFDSVEHITPVHGTTSNFTVPTGKKLVITSNLGWIEIDSIPISSDDIVRDFPIIVGDGITLNLRSNDGRHGFSGYLIDQNRSLGGGLISSTDQTSVSRSIENGSITRDKLSEEILAELGASVSEEELNSTISEKLGSIPPTNGQLLSVPSETEPPLGYTKISDSRIEWKVESLSNSHNYQLNPVSRGKLMSINNTLFCLNYYGSNFTLRHYDDDTSSWKNVENSTPPNSHGSSGDRGWGGSFGSKIYLVGGQGYNNDSIVSVYDTEIGSWSTGPNLPQYDSQYPPYVGEVNGSLYVISHIDNNNYRAFKLEEGSSSWTEVFLNFSTTRTWDGVCLSYLNSLFFVGGSSGSIIEFNTLSNDVTHVTSIPDWSNAGHSSDAAFIFGGKIYVYRNLGHFFSYDISNKSWTRVSKAPGPSASTSLVGHAMTVHKGVPWISGGDLTLSSDSPNSGTTRGFGTYSGMFVPAVYSYSGGSDQGTNLSANTSVTPSMLSDSILKYLMPEIVGQFSTYNGFSSEMNIQANVEGKYLSYQWYKDGEPIEGATTQNFTIDSFDSQSHQGNYNVVVTNDFGSVESQPIRIPSVHSVELNSTVTLYMNWVYPGTFTMGSPESEAGRSTSETQHEVTLTKGFYLGEFEVTQAQYEAVMAGNSENLSATPSNWPNNPDRPVEQVSWDDVQKFLTRLNAQEAGNIPAGWSYVLPTEAQWEYACRAGTTTAYSWGDGITASDANWNHGNDANQTENVGQYSANPWGFFDMHGNVHEWTADAYGTYALGAQTDPLNAGTTSSFRVHRGSYWGDMSPQLRSAARYSSDPSYRHYGIGFRVAFQQQ